MYGLIGKMIAKLGARDALLEAMRGSSANMPGCLSYILALDPPTRMRSGSRRSGPTAKRTKRHLI